MQRMRTSNEMKKTHLNHQFRTSRFTVAFALHAVNVVVQRVGIIERDKGHDRTRHTQRKDDVCVFGEGVRQPRNNRMSPVSDFGFH